MAENLHFTRYIKGVKYKACLTGKLVKTLEFDINQASAYGVIQNGFHLSEQEATHLQEFTILTTLQKY